MSELLGADLDAAVARALGLKAEILQLGHQHENRRVVRVEGRGYDYNPSVSYAEAMGLQVQHDIAVYPDDLANRAGTEKWIAGFNIQATGDDGYTSEAGTYFDGDRAIELNHAARGATPAIAICRAIVARHAAAPAQEKAAIIAAAQAAIRAAAEEHLQQLRAVAWERAQIARRTRVPFTDFANDEERVAYAEAMDQQLTVVQQRNPDLYGGKA